MIGNGSVDDLAGKVAVVTGGATGMGRGIVDVLLAAGMRVAVADVDEAALGAIERSADIHPYHLDVSIAADVDRFAAEVADHFGLIHVVCNNAGVGPIGTISDMTLADWRWVLDVNLWGVIHGVRAFLPILRANADGGAIVNIASGSGLFAVPRFGAYTVSKYGVVAITETLAHELEEEGTRISAGVVLPGPTRTLIAKSLRHRRDEGPSGLSNCDLEQTALFPNGIPWLSPRDVGEIVLEGVLSGDLYLFTHPQLSQPIFDRFERIRAASDAALARQLSGPPATD